MREDTYRRVLSYQSHVVTPEQSTLLLVTPQTCLKSAHSCMKQTFARLSDEHSHRRRADDTVDGDDLGRCKQLRMNVFVVFRVLRGNAQN